MVVGRRDLDLDRTNAACFFRFHGLNGQNQPAVFDACCVRVVIAAIKRVRTQLIRHIAVFLRTFQLWQQRGQIKRISMRTVVRDGNCLLLCAGRYVCLGDAQCNAILRQREIVVCAGGGRKGRGVGFRVTHIGNCVAGKAPCARHLTTAHLCGQAGDGEFTQLGTVDSGSGTGTINRQRRPADVKVYGLGARVIALAGDGQRVRTRIDNIGTVGNFVVRAHCQWSAVVGHLDFRGEGPTGIHEAARTCDRDLRIAAVQAGLGDGQRIAPHGRLPAVSAFFLFSNHHTEDFVFLTGFQGCPTVGVNLHIGGIEGVNAVRVGCHIACGDREFLRCAVLQNIPLETHFSNLSVVCFQRKRKGDRIAADDGADGLFFA